MSRNKKLVGAELLGEIYEKEKLLDGISMELEKL